MTKTIVLSRESIAKRAPAAFTESPSPLLSSRYGFVNTSEVLVALADEGYHVVAAQQDKARARDPRFVRHALTLRHESALQQEAVVGEVVPQILLINSHNGRTKLHMKAGLFRFVCSNGMVMGNSTMGAQIIHARAIADQAVENARRMAAASAKVVASLESWRNIEMSVGATHDFARKAAELRFGSVAAGAYEVTDLLEVKRPEDDGRSLWAVFNRVQENTTQAGLQGKSATGRGLRSKALTGIGENIAYNEALWNLAEAVAV